MKFTLSESSPKSLRVSGGFGAQRLEFLHRFDLRLGRKFRPRIKDTLFVQN